MKRPKAGILLFPFVAALFAPAAARASDNDDAQIWVNMAASGSISGRVMGAFDGNMRFYDNATHLGHVQVRGMLGWEIAKDLQIGGGYSYVRVTPRTGADVVENRIFQQFGFPIAKIGNVKITGRTRFEQRFFSNIDGVRLRARQQVKLSAPLTGPEGLKAIIHSEVMVLLNSQGSTPAGFNQVRTFAGLSIPLMRNTALEAGYLNQAIFPGDDRINHVLSLGLVASY